MFITVGIILFYACTISWTYKFIQKYTRWHDEALEILASVFWIFTLPFLLTCHGYDRIPKIIDSMKKNKEKKELPPIYIEKGAKIQTIDKYEELKRLCSDFEIEFESNKEVNKILGK